MNKVIINNFYKTSNLLIGTLPFFYGCGGGGSSGGGSASVGSLFGSSPTTLAAATTSIGSGGTVEAVTAIPVHHNPEPATLLLWGTGMLAMGFVKSRMRK